MLNIVQVGSPNFSSRRDGVPRVLVMHIMDGSLPGCDSWFNSPQNTEASAHFGIGKNGEVHQYVDPKFSAWANGIVDNIDHGWATNFLNGLPNGASPNRFSISVEHEGHSGDRLDGLMFGASVALAVQLFGPGGALDGVLCDREHVLRHGEIGNHPLCPGFPEEDMQHFIEVVNTWLHMGQPAPQKPAWAVAAESTDTTQEVEVEIRQLDQGESIAALNKAAAVHGMAINDQNGETVVEITKGSPIQPPPGGHVYAFTTKD